MASLAVVAIATGVAMAMDAWNSAEHGGLAFLRGIAWECQGKYGEATADDIAEGHSLNGKTVIVTGSNTGVGKETARVMAKIGAHVVMTCRSLEKCQKAQREIDPAGIQTEVMQLDLRRLKSVDAFSSAFLEKNTSLDYLVNNAGVLLGKNGFHATADGIEMHWGVNHLGHFRLTTNLLDRLVASGPGSRVISLASLSHKLVGEAPRSMSKWPLTKDTYDSTLAYAISKASTILFTLELRKRLKGTGVLVAAGHPGVVFSDHARHDADSRFAYEYIYPFLEKVFRRKFLKTTQQGAANTMCMALHDLPDGSAGPLTNRLYFSDCVDPHAISGNQAIYSRVIFDETVAAKLWNRSEQILTCAIEGPGHSSCVTESKCSSACEEEFAVCVHKGPGYGRCVTELRTEDPNRPLHKFCDSECTFSASMLALGTNGHGSTCSSACEQEFAWCVHKGPGYERCVAELRISNPNKPLHKLCDAQCTFTASMLAHGSDAGI